MNIREAAEKWVKSFSVVPKSVLEKLSQLDDNDVQEVAFPTLYDTVYIYDDGISEYAGKYGEIVEITFANNDAIFVIEPEDFDGGRVMLKVGEFEIVTDDVFPMWGIMWAFTDPCDKRWIDSEEAIQAMIECNFRIYKQEDYGYVFGIDGGGYDFYENHWIPLYKARGLRWHDEED